MACHEQTALPAQSPMPRGSDAHLRGRLAVEAKAQLWEETLKHSLLKLIAGAVAAASLSTQGLAQDAASYPSRTVTIVVPTSPGSGTDGAMRHIVEALSKKWGQPVVIENVPGGGTTLGAAKVANAAPDGYTLLASTVSSIGLAPIVRPDLSYGLDDFVMVSHLNNSTGALVVNPDSIKARTLDELVAEMKENPGRFNYGAVGAGTINHLHMELFMDRTGTEAVLVPFASGGEVMTALLGGHIEMAFNSLASALPQIQAGTLVALGVTLNERDPSLPDVPTMHEVYPNIPPLSPWAGLSAPAATPKPIVDKISADIAEYLHSDEGKAAMKTVGGSIAVGSTPEEFDAMIRQEYETWKEVITSRNIKVE